MSESEYRLRDREVNEDQRERWLAMRAQDLRSNPKELVKALNEIHSDDLTASLTTLIYGVTKFGGDGGRAVIEGWISMVVQDEDARGEWRDRDE